MHVVDLVMCFGAAVMACHPHFCLACVVCLVDVIAKRVQSLSAESTVMSGSVTMCSGVFGNTNPVVLLLFFIYGGLCSAFLPTTFQCVRITATVSVVIT